MNVPMDKVISVQKSHWSGVMIQSTARGPSAGGVASPSSVLNQSRATVGGETPAASALRAASPLEYWDRPSRIPATALSIAATSSVRAAVARASTLLDRSAAPLDMRTVAARSMRARSSDDGSGRLMRFGNNSVDLGRLIASIMPPIPMPG